MRISRKAQYALQASLDLALHGTADRGSRTAEIASRTGVPEKFLEAILRDLRQAGLVTSKRGPDGGHRLASDPGRVTAGAVIEAIDGPLSGAANRKRHRARPEEVCVLSLWDRVESAVQDILGGVTLEDLRREAVAPGPVDYSI